MNKNEQAKRLAHFLKLRGVEHNAPEEFVFPHIAALFGTLTSVWFRQRSTTLHEKTSPSGAKQFLKSKFLSRQGKKVSNADALRGFLTQYRRKFAFKNRIGFDSPQLISIRQRKIQSAACLFVFPQSFRFAYMKRFGLLNLRSYYDKIQSEEKHTDTIDGGKDEDS